MIRFPEHREVLRRSKSCRGYSARRALRGV